MARENPSWGEERIANELLLKIGIRVSPRTVNKYLDQIYLKISVENRASAAAKAVRVLSGL